MFMEKRKEKDRRNELDDGSRRNTQAFNKVKEMARLRRSVHRLKVAAKSRDKISIGQEGVKDQDKEGRGSTAEDIAVQVKLKDPRERKTKFVDEVQDGISSSANTQKSRSLKSPEAEVITESVIMDNWMSMEDLESEGEDPNEVRLRHLNFRQSDPTENEKRCRSYLATKKHRKSLPPNAKILQARNAVRKKCEEEQLMPMTRNDLRIPPLPTLGGTICTGHSKIWKDADDDPANMDYFDLISLNQNTVESKWRNLLEELYPDKKYFDYVIRTKTPTEGDILAKALDGLEFLYERAIFWEQQEPIPPRPAPYILEKYRNNILSPRTAAPKTVFIERPTCLPITQVSILKKRAENSRAEGKKANEGQTGTMKTDERKEPTENQLERDAIPLTYFNLEREKTRDFKFEPEKTTLSILPTREPLGNRKVLHIKENTDVSQPITPTTVKDERFSKNQYNSASVIETNVKRYPGQNSSNSHDSRKAENFQEPAQWASRKPIALIKTRITSSFRRKKELESQPRAKSAGYAVHNVIFEGGDG